MYMREALHQAEAAAEIGEVPVGAVVVRSPEGNVNLDFGGKAPGRGAYLCPDPECLRKAQRSKALERSLEVPIPQEVYDRLAKEMEARRGE